MKKLKIKEDISDDIDKVKALKRKTRKVLKDPSKAGDVADDLADGGVDAPADDAKTPDKPVADEPVVADDGVTEPTADDDGIDVDGDEADDTDGEGHPDLGTFLEQALANSKDAIEKYEKQLDELKKKVKKMGLEVPGLLDPDDVSDEETPEEFPDTADDQAEPGDDDIEPPADDGEGGADDGDIDAPPPADDSDGGDEGGDDGLPSMEDEAGFDEPSGDDDGESQASSPKEKPAPAKDVEPSIAKPVPTKGTKLK